jgi:Zn-dependent peptidase ImmA (M78 family)
MPLDLKIFGSKLERYRKQFQASIDEVSSATGIEAQLLSLYEKGKKEPTGDDILILADYFKCDYSFFVSSEALALFEQTETLFRKHDKELTKEDRWAIQEFLFLCENEEFLLEIIPKLKRKEFVFHKSGRYYKKHGEEAAHKLREHLGYKSNQVVIDIYDDLRKVKLHVFRRLLNNTSISGVFIKHPSAGKCILINYNEDIYRQRFTAAHEAAHSILDDKTDDFISFTKPEGDKLSETRANTFAARYLMPQEFLKKIPAPGGWSKEEVLTWANKLKVSTEALAYSLREANLITYKNSQVIRTYKVPSKDKTDPELPNDLSPKVRQQREELLKRGLSAFYVNLSFEAYERGMVSAGKLAEILLVTEVDLENIANIFGTKLKYDN